MVEEMTLAVCIERLSVCDCCQAPVSPSDRPRHEDGGTRRQCWVLLQSETDDVIILIFTSHSSYSCSGGGGVGLKV